MHQRERGNIPALENPHLVQDWLSGSSEQSFINILKRAQKTPHISWDFACKIVSTVKSIRFVAARSMLVQCRC